MAQSIKDFFIKINLIKRKIKFEFIFWLENLFKYKHGYSKNCIGKKSKKCTVCNTPWPIIEKTPTRKYLESIDYYNHYRAVYFPSNENDGLSHVGGIYKGGYLEFPKGMSGQELIEIAKKLKPEYDILTKGKGEEEIKKRGALEGYDEKDISKS